MPVLFLPYECHGARHWSKHMAYLAERGITAAAFDFERDGLAAMEVSSLNPCTHLVYSCTFHVSISQHMAYLTEGGIIAAAFDLSAMDL